MEEPSLVARKEQPQALGFARDHPTGKWLCRKLPDSPGEKRVEHQCLPVRRPVVFLAALEKVLTV